MTLFQRISGSMIVINDGSRDGTGAILDRLAREIPELRVIHQPNGGHGSAVLTGYRAAIDSPTDYVFQTDSDDQFRPEDFWKLWEARGQSPFICGYRKERQDARTRLFITKVVVVLNFVLFGAWMRDSNVPYRLMKASYLDRLLHLVPSGVFAPNIFLSVLAVKSGSRLLEIPIRHEDRKTGTVSILRWKLLKVCFRCARELFVFRVKTFGNREELARLKAQYA